MRESVLSVTHAVPSAVWLVRKHHRGCHRGRVPRIAPPSEIRDRSGRALTATRRWGMEQTKSTHRTETRAASNRKALPRDRRPWLRLPCEWVLEGVARGVECDRLHVAHEKRHPSRNSFPWTRRKVKRQQELGSAPSARGGFVRHVAWNQVPANERSAQNLFKGNIPP